MKKRGGEKEVGEEREKGREKERFFFFSFVFLLLQIKNSVRSKRELKSPFSPPHTSLRPSTLITAMATLSSLSRGMRAASAAPVASRRPASARRAAVRVVASSAAPAPSPADEQPSRVSGGVIGAGGVGTIGSTLRAALPSDYAKAKIKVRGDERSARDGREG